MSCILLKELKKLLLITSVFLFVLPVIWSNENDSEQETTLNLFSQLEQDMDDYTSKKSMEWSFNPFDRPHSDRGFSPWTDPLAYNSYWYVYYPPLVKDYYEDEKFNHKDVIFYHSPQLGASVTPIAFYLDEMKYRFYVGVGFLMNGYFQMYGHGATQYYGTHLFLNSLIQVESFIDFIYKDNLRIRLTPVRHICYHMSGDILGDEKLTPVIKDSEGNITNFKDVGFEQVHASVNYKWGWFNFYGGLAAAITNFTTANYVNLAYFYSGAEMKVPVWGNLEIIAGLHVGGNYDRINSIKRIMEGNQYICTGSRKELTPIISAGLGFGIHNWVMGLKFDYARSRQIYAMDNMEMRIGFSAGLLL